MQVGRYVWHTLYIVREYAGYICNGGHGEVEDQDGAHSVHTLQIVSETAMTSEKAVFKMKSFCLTKL